MTELGDVTEQAPRMLFGCQTSNRTAGASWITNRAEFGVDEDALSAIENLIAIHPCELRSPWRDMTHFDQAGCRWCGSAATDQCPSSDLAMLGITIVTQRPQACWRSASGRRGEQGENMVGATQVHYCRRRPRIHNRGPFAVGIRVAA